MRAVPGGDDRVPPALPLRVDLGDRWGGVPHLAVAPTPVPVAPRRSRPDLLHLVPGGPLPPGGSPDRELGRRGNPGGADQVRPVRARIVPHPALPPPAPGGRGIDPG